MNLSVRLMLDTFIFFLYYKCGDIMKRSKRIFAVICIIISAVLMCAPIISLAAVRTGEGEATLLQEGEFDIATGESVHLGALSSTQETVAERVYSALLNYSDEIDVSSLRYNVSQIEAFYSNIINDNADLFFVSSSYIYYYSQFTNKVTAIVPQYAMPQSEKEAALEVFYEGAELALEEVDDSMTDLQKALTIHDYICSYAVYPQIYDENGKYVKELDLDIYHSAYGFFKDFNAVCAGYTLTFSYLMHRLGIECEYVSSAAMEHAWNKIKIDGNWYNVDITYDNSDFVEAENTYGMALHTCFMKSDSYFQSEDGLIHFDYSSFDAGDANDTTYDSCFWDDINSRIYTVNGDYYYLEPNYNNQYVRLRKRTLSGNVSFLNTSMFYAPTFSFTLYREDSSGVLHEIPHSDILARIVYLDGKFYVNDYNDIYAVLLSGKKVKAFEDTGYLISLGSVQGDIVYQTYDDMSDVVKIDKTEYFSDYLTTSSSSAYHVYPDCNNDGIINGRDWAHIISIRN